jgi:hypothetical protein
VAPTGEINTGSLGPLQYSSQFGQNATYKEIFFSDNLRQNQDSQNQEMSSSFATAVPPAIYFETVNWATS